MPIRPENKVLYPANWKQIRADILAECESKCEFCGVRNGVYVVRDKYQGHYYEFDSIPAAESWIGDWESEYFKPAKVVLTIAHLDQDPTNNARENLRALCQKCHNQLDAPYRAKNRKTNLFNDQLKAGQIKMEGKHDE